MENDCTTIEHDLEITLVSWCTNYCWSDLFVHLQFLGHDSCEKVSIGEVMAESVILAPSHVQVRKWAQHLA